MNGLDESKIATIVERVISRLNQESQGRAKAPAIPGPVGSIKGENGVFPDVDSAMNAAKRAQEELDAKPLEHRAKIIEALRQVSRALNHEIARMTVEETGFGRVSDKINKNLLVANKTPGIEILRTMAYTGDDGLMLTERAPYGVIGAITPCTNATETIICNTIGMVAAGNAVVFNVHPSAKKVSNYLVGQFNQAIQKLDGPANIICTVGDPTIESAQQLMKHPLNNLLVVTGGPAVVKVAMNSGKKVIAAGPGNPPAVVDETAHIERAAKDIILGASLDNNIVCIVEKEIIAVAKIADRLMTELERNGAYRLSDGQVGKLEKMIITSKNEVNKDYIGKNVNVIVRDLGVNLSDEVRIAFCEVDEHHPFVQHEQLMPVIPLVRVPDVYEGIAMARRVEHDYRHTATMHSTNIDALSKMARVMNTSIFVKNAPSYAGLGMGGEGYTSFTIASPTGEGLTTALHFSRERRCTLKDSFRIV